MIKDSFIYYHLFSIIDDRIFVFIITEEEYYKVMQKRSDLEKNSSWNLFYHQGNKIFTSYKPNIIIIMIILHDKRRIDYMQRQRPLDTEGGVGRQMFVYKVSFFLIWLKIYFIPISVEKWYSK